jgi:uncharacterized membrane protein YkvA (DUF1232 family)
MLADMKQWSLTGLMRGALVSLLLLGSTGSAAAGLGGDDASSLGPRLLVAESIDEALGEAAIGLSRGLRQLGYDTVRILSRAMNAWGRYARRAVKFVVLALLIGLVDRNLLAAWRSSGLRVLTTYVPLMTYVYTRLLFDSRVRSLGKVVLLGAIAYGVVRRDLLPDRSFFPGLVDDVVLLVIAVRLLLSWCRDDIVYAHATEAIERWRKIATLQRARPR